VSKARRLVIQFGNAVSAKKAIEAFVAGSSTAASWLPRLSIRGLFFLILLVALLLGWVSSEQRSTRERQQQEQRLRYAEEEADLTGATLTGGGVSFQNATFEKAILIGATLPGNFQLVNFSGARLEGADLSAIAGNNLASCYFKEPPTYDARTKFPAGFDPVERSWRRVK
jgi:hypothetical protein